MKIVRMRSVYGRTEQRRALVAADILSHSRGRAAGLDPVTELDAAVDPATPDRGGSSRAEAPAFSSTRERRLRYSSAGSPMVRGGSHRDGIHPCRRGDPAGRLL